MNAARQAAEAVTYGIRWAIWAPLAALLTCVVALSIVLLVLADLIDPDLTTTHHSPGDFGDQDQ